MKHIIKIVVIPCLIYSTLFLVSKLFLFIAALEWGLFSAILGLIGIILQFPNSMLDVLIVGYNFEWIILMIGFSYSAYWVYDMFN
jgi:hypothetical protein